MDSLTRRGNRETYQRHKAMKTKDQLIQLGIEGFKADEIMLLQSKMQEQAVKFQFKKKDGSIRTAVGTLRRDLMVLKDGSLWEPKGEAKPNIPERMDYFDIEAQWWRCFTCTDFIGIAEA